MYSIYMYLFNVIIVNIYNSQDMEAAKYLLIDE